MTKHSESESEMLRLLLGGEKEIEAGKGYDLDVILREADTLLKKAQTDAVDKMVRCIHDEQVNALAGKFPNEIVAFSKRTGEAARREAKQGHRAPHTSSGDDTPDDPQKIADTRYQS
jgi:hypothetical protein